ncbi:MAG: SsrA-binding protein SmpB [Rickettsiales bacterium]|jgi:SsrA-binding protein|nr:SsrA-binding protein SmpB [Rickettsiales bacterium]
MKKTKRHSFITTGLVAENRKGHFNYELTDNFEAGIALLGPEVKSLRQGKVNIKDAYVVDRDGELYLANFSILPYDGSLEKTDPKRYKKLLLKKKEISKIKPALNEKGYAVIPTKLYFNNKGLAKINLSIGKGKNVIDKRETIKKREWDRAQHRILKNAK